MPQVVGFNIHCQTNNWDLAEETNINWDLGDLGELRRAKHANREHLEASQFVTLGCWGIKSYKLQHVCWIPFAKLT